MAREKIMWELRSLISIYDIEEWICKDWKPYKDYWIECVFQAEFWDNWYVPAFTRWYTSTTVHLYKYKWENFKVTEVADHDGFTISINIE